MRIQVRCVLSGLCALAGSLALGVNAAPAFDAHNFLTAPSAKLAEGVPATGPHGEAIAASGPFSGSFAVESMTVDSGELYVAEEGRIDKFDASTGSFLGQFPLLSTPSHLDQGIAVGHSTGESQIYVTGDEFPGGSAQGVVAVFNAAGHLLHVWTGADAPGNPGEAKAFGCFECGGPAGVAVDGSSSVGDWAAGDVYVPDLPKHVVDVFKPEASGGEKYVTQLTGPEPPGVLFSAPSSVAVNQSNGEVYVLDRAPSTENFYVYIFKPAAIADQYEFIGKLAGPDAGSSFTQTRGVTVDGGNGDIYVYGRGDVPVVEQFAANGEHIGRLTGDPTGPFEELHSLAVDPADHDLYVGGIRQREDLRGEPQAFGVVDVFGPSVVVPDVLTEAASSVSPSTATLNGKVNPDKEGEASCRFAWGTSREFGQTAPCEPENVAEGASAMNVHATLSGLQPDTTYYYRLQASNKNGTNPGEPGQDGEFRTRGPGLRSETVSNVAATSATLEATIDPNNAPTTYYLQYGTSSAYGSVAPAAPGTVGGGEAPVEVGQHVQGLAAATTYHYRVVALSEVEAGVTQTFYGADETFVTQGPGSFALPDGRRWEMVSPPDKFGAVLESSPAEWGGIVQAASDGNGITYIADAPTEAEPPGNPAIERVQLLAKRGASGWSTKVIAVPRTQTNGLQIGRVSEYELFSSDLSLALVEPKQEAQLSAESTERTPYLRHNEACEASPTSCYQPLVTAANVPAGTKFGSEPELPTGQVKVEAATPDLSHLAISAKVALTETPVENGLYEWVAGKLQLVSVLPSDEGGKAVAGEIRLKARHSISDDGSRIIWTRQTDGIEESGLYMTDTVTGAKIRLDVAESGAQSTYNNRPVFQAASSNGSHVFFTDEARLTPDSSASKNISDLYEFNTETGKLTDLTVDLNTGERAHVLNLVIGASEDGSSVYFVADGVLAQGAKPGNCVFSQNVQAQESQTCNLYESHDGVTTFIASLSGADGKAFPEVGLQNMAARVSPNGRWLAFMSDRSLTGYDNRDANSGVPDEEVFLYDAQTKRLTCASCDPTGARPVGVFDTGEYPGLLWDRAKIFAGYWLAAGLPGWTSVNGSRSFYQSRYLSDSGRLFFNSNDALQPQDTNGTADVYEYEPEGAGNCEQTSVTFHQLANGCVSLISSGGSSEESAFVDASENGEDVFFLTTASLLPQDYDGVLDLYDARVCTASSPCLAVPPVTPPACSTGDSCKPAPALQPESFGAPSSETFAGAGNVSVSASPSVVEKPQTSSSAKKLAKALRLCRAKKPKRKRQTCERQAKRSFAKKAAERSKAKTSLSTRTGR